MITSFCRATLAWLACAAFALSQGSQLPKYTVATLPAASTQPHYIVQVIDGASSTDCATGGGAQNVACVNVAGVWHALGTVSPTFTGTVTVNSAPTYSVHIGPLGTMTASWNFDTTTAATACASLGCSTGGGTVTAFAAPSASWPSWLVPTVTNSTTAPSLAVAASAIPNSSLANSSTTVNGQTCTLGSSCSVSTSTPNSVTFNNSGSGGASGSTFNGGSALTVSYNTIGAAASNASTTVNGQPCTLGSSCSISVGTGTITGVTAGSGMSGGGTSGTVTVTNAAPMVYPGAGIPNSTGSAWSTSYSTAGSGSYLLLTNANIQITRPTTAISANSCTSPASIANSAVIRTSSFATAFVSNPNSVTGWGSSGGLVLTLWPTSGNINWSVCNQSSASITGGAMTVNVGVV